MKEFNYTITDALGLHARPAGQIAKLAMEFACDIKITARFKTVDAKRIMGIMGLCAKKDDDMVITFEGADEDKAYDALTTYIKEHL